MDINFTHLVYGVMAFTMVWMIAAYWVGYWQGRWRERDNHKLAGQTADDTLHQLEEWLERTQRFSEETNITYFDALEDTLNKIEELSKEEVSPYA